MPNTILGTGEKKNCKQNKNSSINGVYILLRVINQSINRMTSKIIHLVELHIFTGEKCQEDKK